MCLVDFRYSYWAEGSPGISGRCFQKSTFFSERFFMFFHCFVPPFWDDFGMVFLLIYLPFSSPIFGRFSYRISSFFASLLFRRTLADTRSTR